MGKQENDVYVPYYFGAVEEARKNWIWFLLLGIVLVLAGAGAIYASVLTTIITVVLLGTLALVSGVIQLVSSFWARKWSGFFLSLFAGVLYTVLGIVIIGHPAISAVGLTLLIAAFYIVAGVFRITAALTHRFQNWGLTLSSGIISLALGILIWAQWPFSGLWIIGLFVGIDLIFMGASWIYLAIAAKRYVPAA